MFSVWSYCEKWGKWFVSLQNNLPDEDYPEFGTGYFSG